MNNTFEILTELRVKFEKSKSKNRITILESAIPIEKLKEVENRINFRFPPEFVYFVTNYGRFEIGNPNADHLSFKILPLNEIKAASKVLAEMLNVSSNEKVAKKLGLNEEYINELDKIIVFSLLGHEDYYGFDSRFQDNNTLHCPCVGVLFDDLEIEFLAKREITKSAKSGFDELMKGLIKNNKNWE